MTNLTKRLRKAALTAMDTNGIKLDDMCLQAAYTIERLEKTISDMKGKENA